MILLWGFQQVGGGGLLISHPWEKCSKHPVSASPLGREYHSEWPLSILHLSQDTGEPHVTTGSHLSGFYYVLGRQSPWNSWSCLSSAQVGATELFV